MCIIATKDVNYKLPDEATLKRCFDANPDGAGFAWSDEAAVYWKKGYMTFESFYAELKSLFPTEELERKYAMILHFRIGTHGPKKGPTHTHPFPCDAESMQGLTALSGSTSMALFHNGIIYDMTKVPCDKVKVDETTTLVEPSDSMVLAQEFVNPMLKAYNAGLFSVDNFNNMMTQYIGSSRIALLEDGGRISTYGSWEQDVATYPGCWFSNGGYKYREPYVAPVSKWTPKSGSYFEDDAFDAYGNDYWLQKADKRVDKATKATKVTKFTQKSKQQLLDTSASNRITPAEAIQKKSFWKSYANIGRVSNKDLEPLPIASQVTFIESGMMAEFLANKPFISYMPDLDGDLYYHKTPYMANKFVTTLFVKKADKYHKIFGSYLVKLSKGGLLNYAKKSKYSDDFVAM